MQQKGDPWVMGDEWMIEGDYLINNVKKSCWRYLVINLTKNSGQNLDKKYRHRFS